MKRILIYILSTILLSSSIYAITYYSHIEDTARLLNIAFCVPVWGILLLFFPKSLKIKSFSFIMVSFSILWMSFWGILYNSITQILPTLVRYSLYLLCACFAYTYVLRYNNKSFLRTIRCFLYPFIIVSVFWALYEVVTGQVEYLNGAYRLSGSFKHHQLAAALFYYVLMILYGGMYLKPHYSVGRLLVLLILASLLFATQSRALLAISLIVALLYVYTGVKSAKVFVITMCITGLVFVIAYYVVFFTEALPRIKESFTMDEGEYDNSTMTRILIIENTLENLTGLKLLTGIGLGGFELFYKDITGEGEVAAHNNYLLFYSEGGLPSLVSYILFQLSFVKDLFVSIRQNRTIINTITFFLFMGITIFSFMLNNYYFYCSEIFVWLFLGAYYAEKKRQKTNVYNKLIRNNLR